MASPWLWSSAVLLTFATMASAYSPIPVYNTELMKTDYYLPRSVTPTGYAIKLHPHISEGRYNGSVEINVTCQESTSIIVLHAHQEVNITHAEIKNTDNNIGLEIINISRNATNETISISFEEPLQIGVSYKLYILFAGELLTESKIYGLNYDQQKQNGGFIYSTISFPDPEQERLLLAITVSPRSLRRVFPCFDEPSFKATFQISISHWSNMTAKSVMPLESSEIYGDDLVFDHFSTTPPLSTSSVSVLVVNYNDLNNSINVSSTNGDFSVYFSCREGIYYKTWLHNPINTTVKILEYLQDYLGVPYPLPKLDIVDVVHNIYNSGSFSTLGLIKIPNYMMHELFKELADQWFKHMTTPQEWHFFNITNILSDYMITSATEKLGIKKEPIQLEKGDLYNIFSTFVGGYGHFYDTMKGTWFLQMLNDTLTEKTMQTALGNLVKNNMYSTYTPDTLWEEITNQAYADGMLPESITVQEIAHSWLNNQRFPVLTALRNYDDNTANLQQHVYIYPETQNLTDADQEKLWSIPISYLTNSVEKSSMLQPVTWMSNKEMVIDNFPDANSYIIINPIDSGMFLVNYDNHNWELISESLLSPENNLSAQTRKKVVQDALILASTGELNYSTALNVTVFLLNETDYSVWMSFIKHFNLFDQISQYTSVASKLNIYIRLLLSPIFDSGTKPELYKQSSEYMNFWHQARYLLEKVGYQPFINERQQKINETMPIFSYYDNETELVILCPENPTNGTQWSTYANHIQQFVPMPYSFLHKAFCKCPGYTDHVKRKLNKTLDEETSYASYEFYQILQEITSYAESYNITFNFFFEHFDELKQRYYYVKDVWNGLVSGIVDKVQTKEHLTKLTQFFKENEKKFGYSNSTVRDAIKKAEKAIEKNDVQMHDIEPWLDRTLPLLRKHNA